MVLRCVVGFALVGELVRARVLVRVAGGREVRYRRRADRGARGAGGGGGGWALQPVAAAD